MRSSCKTVFLQSALGLDGFTWRLLAAHQGNKHTLLHHWQANPALLRLLFVEVGQVRCLATQCLHGLSYVWPAPFRLSCYAELRFTRQPI